MSSNYVPTPTQSFSWDSVSFPIARQHSITENILHNFTAVPHPHAQNKEKHHTKHTLYTERYFVPPRDCLINAIFNFNCTMWNTILIILPTITLQPFSLHTFSPQNSCQPFQQHKQKNRERCLSISIWAKIKNSLTNLIKVIIPLSGLDCVTLFVCVAGGQLNVDDMFHSSSVRCFFFFLFHN